MWCNRISIKFSIQFSIQFSIWFSLAALLMEMSLTLIRGGTFLYCFLFPYSALESQQLSAENFNSGKFIFFV